MPTVRMRATATMPRQVRQRYATRMLTADDDDTFDVPAKWAQMFRKARWAEDALDEPAAPEPRKRGRPRKAKPPEAAGGSVKADEYAPPLEDKTVAELRDMADEQGVDLPGGYVKHDELVAMLEDAGEADDAR